MDLLTSQTTADLFSFRHRLSSAHHHWLWLSRRASSVFCTNWRCVRSFPTFHLSSQLLCTRLHCTFSWILPGVLALLLTCLVEWSRRHLSSKHHHWPLPGHHASFGFYTSWRYVRSFPISRLSFQLPCTRLHCTSFLTRPGALAFGPGTRPLDLAPWSQFTLAFCLK